MSRKKKTVKAEEKQTKKQTAKKPVVGKTTTGKNTGFGAGKTATGNKSGSGRTSQSAKRTPKKQETPKKEKRLSEFRYPKKRPNDNQIIHPVYVFKKIEDFFIFFGLTHDSNKSNRSKVKALEYNPNPKKRGEKAYIKKKAEKKKSEDFSPRLKGWQFWSKKDKDLVQELVKKNNKKRKGG